MCSQIGYQGALFPNFLSHEMPQEAVEELNDYMPLIREGCSNAIVHLLCSVYAPFCYNNTRGQAQGLRPCREMCQYVKDGCVDVLESFGFGWPMNLDCQNEEIFMSSADTSSLAFCPPDLRALTIPANVIPTTPTTNSGTDLEAARCEDTSVVPVCSNMGYEQAFFPNFRHQSPSQANRDLKNFMPLINSNCSGFLLDLLCSVHAPVCSVDGNGSPRRLNPCVDLCRVVKTSCEPFLVQHGLQWPSHLDCNNNEIYQPNGSHSYCPSGLHTPRNDATQATPTAVSTVDVGRASTPTPRPIGMKICWT